jgi:hypothetical protein
MGEQDEYRENGPMKRASSFEKIVVCFVILSLCLTGPVFAAGQVKIDKHKDKGVACASCHEKAEGYTRPADSVCMGCHGSYAELAKKTAPRYDARTGIDNPHKSHIGEARCTLCHKNHVPSVLYCNQCHSPKFEMKVP